MKNKIGIILIVIIIAVSLVGGYFLINNKHNRTDFPGIQNNEFDKKGFNQTFNEDTKSEIISFFENNEAESIKDYCNKNPPYCMYYCREIDSSNEICSQMQPPDPRK
ncbi:MAG: hypothetical protein WC438_00270 [Candidatus Pacearchaeota archaeon]